MAKRVVLGGGDEGLQKVVDSVFNSNIELSDLSFSGTSLEDDDSDSNSSSETSEESDNNECAPVSSKCVFVLRRRKI
jgi:hypothetical protein